jgi:hypothetical protein
MRPRPLSTGSSRPTMHASSSNTSIRNVKRSAVLATEALVTRHRW